MSAGKKWAPTPEMIKQIGDLAKKGVTEANIARIVGLSPTVFSGKKKVFPEIENVIKAAQASGEHEVVGYLWNIMRNPEHRQHLTACLFYLKTRHGWKDHEFVIQNAKIQQGATFVQRETIAPDSEEIVTPTSE